MIFITFRIIFLVCVFSCCYGVHANSLLDAEYSVDLKSGNITDVLYALSEQTETNIAMVESQLEKSMLCCDLTGTFSLYHILEYIFQNQELSYKVLNNSIIVSRNLTLQTNENTVKPQATGIEEILVIGFANKQQTGSAVFSSRIDSEYITQKNIKTPITLGSQTVGIGINGTQSPTFFIRGVGYSDNTDLGDPLVGLYINGLYQPKILNTLTTWFDLESIVISQGPYTAPNKHPTTAGFIDVHYKKPEIGLTQHNIKLGYGSYDYQSLEAVANYPLTTNSALRISAYAEKQDSFFKNINPYTSPQKASSLPGALDNSHIRAQLHWQPNPVWNIGLLASHNSSKDLAAPLVALDNYLQRARTLGITEGQDYIPEVEDIPQANYFDVYFGARRAFQNHTSSTISLSTEIAKDAHKLTLDSSINNYDLQSRYSRNYGVAFPSSRDYNPSTQGKQQLELTDVMSVQDLEKYGAIDSASKGKTRSTLLSYQFSAGSFEIHSALNLANEDLRWFWADAVDRGDFNIGTVFQTHYKSQLRSATLEAIWHASDKIKLEAGLTQTESKKSRRGIGIATSSSNFGDVRFATPGFSWNIDLNTIIDPNAYDDPAETYLDGMPITNLSYNDKRVITPAEEWFAFRHFIKTWGTQDTVQNIDIPAIANFYISEQNGATRSKKINPYASLDYKIGDNLDLTAEIIHVKSQPGFNDNLYSEISPTYESESAKTYNLGMRWQYGTGALSASTYRTVTKQKIGLLSVTPAIVFADAIPPEAFSATNLDTTREFRLNLGDSTSTGFEISLETELPHQIFTTVTALYTDAKYNSGIIQDARMAAFSNFTNADPLRFNTVDTHFIVPDSNGQTHSHTYDIYANTVNPNYQRHRPGVDMNQDGHGSYWLGVYCDEGAPTIRGDGQCISVNSNPPLIEAPLRSLNGKRPPRTPQWDIAFDLKQIFSTPHPLISEAYWMLGARYRSEYFLTPYNGNGYEPVAFEGTTNLEYDVAPSFYDRVNSHIIWHAGLGLNSQNNRWEGSLHIENILNTIYKADLINTAWDYAVTPNAPRIIKAYLSYQF